MVVRRIAVCMVGAVVLAGCRGSPASQSAPAPQGVTHGVTSASPPLAVATFSALDCNVIDDQAPPPGRITVLNAVSLPDPVNSPALGTSRDRHPDTPAETFFAKDGLGIRPGRGWRISVPAQAAGHLLIGWGSPGVPSLSVGPPTCRPPASTSGWMWFPGGYWTDRPGCYPLLVEAGGHAQRTTVGVGAPCRGQQPPQGQSDK